MVKVVSRALCVILTCFLQNKTEGRFSTLVVQFGTRDGEVAGVSHRAYDP